MIRRFILSLAALLTLCLCLFPPQLVTVGRHTRPAGFRSVLAPTQSIVTFAGMDLPPTAAVYGLDYAKFGALLAAIGVSALVAVASTTGQRSKA